MHCLQVAVAVLPRPFPFPLSLPAVLPPWLSPAGKGGGDASRSATAWVHAQQQGEEGAAAARQHTLWPALQQQLVVASGGEYALPNCAVELLSSSSRSRSSKRGSGSSSSSSGAGTDGRGEKRHGEKEKEEDAEEGVNIIVWRGNAGFTAAAASEEEESQEGCSRKSALLLVRDLHKLQKTQRKQQLVGPAEEAAVGEPYWAGKVEVEPIVSIEIAMQEPVLTRGAQTAAALLLKDAYGRLIATPSNARLEAFSSHPSLLRAHVKQGDLFAPPLLILEAAAASQRETAAPRFTENIRGRESVIAAAVAATAASPPSLLAADLPTGCAAVTVFLLSPLAAAAACHRPSPVAAGGAASASLAARLALQQQYQQPPFLFDTLRVCVGSSTLLPSASFSAALPTWKIAASRAGIAARPPAAAANAALSLPSSAAVTAAATPLRLLPFSRLHLLLPGSLAAFPSLPQQLSFRLSFNLELLLAAAAAVACGRKLSKRGSCSESQLLQSPLLPQSVAAAVSILFSSLLHEEPAASEQTSPATAADTRVAVAQSPALTVGFPLLQLPLILTLQEQEWPVAAAAAAASTTHDKGGGGGGVAAEAAKKILQFRRKGGNATAPRAVASSSSTAGRKGRWTTAGEAATLSFQVTLTDLRAVVSTLLQHQSSRSARRNQAAAAEEEEIQSRLFAGGSTAAAALGRSFCSTAVEDAIREPQRIDGIDLLLQLLRRRLASLWWWQQQQQQASKRTAGARAAGEGKGRKRGKKQEAAVSAGEAGAAACAAAVAAVKRAARCNSSSSSGALLTASPEQQQKQQMLLALVPPECLVNALDWTASFAPATSISSKSSRSSSSGEWRQQLRSTWWRSTRPAVVSVSSPRTSGPSAAAAVGMDYSSGSKLPEASAAAVRGGSGSSTARAAATAIALSPGAAVLELPTGEDMLQVEVISAAEPSSSINSHGNSSSHASTDSSCCKSRWRFLVAAGCSVPQLLGSRRGWHALDAFSSSEVGSSASVLPSAAAKENRKSHQLLFRWEQLLRQAGGCSRGNSKQGEQAKQRSTLFSWGDSAGASAATHAAALPPDAYAAVSASPAVLIRVQIGDGQQQQQRQRVYIPQQQQQWKGMTDEDEEEEGSHWAEISSSPYIESSASVSCSIANPLLSVLYSGSSYSLPLLLAEDSRSSPDETTRRRSSSNGTRKTGKESSSHVDFWRKDSVERSAGTAITSSIKEEVVTAHACVLQPRRLLSVGEHLQRLLLIVDEQEHQQQRRGKQTHDREEHGEDDGGTGEEVVSPCDKLFAEEARGLSHGPSVWRNSVDAAAAAFAAGVAPVAITVDSAEAKVALPLFFALPDAGHTSTAARRSGLTDAAALMQKQQVLLSEQALQQMAMQQISSSGRSSVFSNVSGCVAWPLQRRMLLLHDPSFMRATPTETTIYIEKHQQVLMRQRQQQQQPEQQRQKNSQKEEDDAEKKTEEEDEKEEDGEAAAAAATSSAAAGLNEEEEEDFFDAATAAALLESSSRTRSRQQQQQVPLIDQPALPRQLPLTFFVYPVPPAEEDEESLQQQRRQQSPRVQQQQRKQKRRRSSVEASVTSDLYRVLLQQKGLLLAVRVEAAASPEAEEEAAAAAAAAEQLQAAEGAAGWPHIYTIPDETAAHPFGAGLHSRDTGAAGKGVKGRASTVADWEAPAVAQVMLECRAWRQLLTVRLEAGDSRSRMQQQHRRGGAGSVAANVLDGEEEVQQQFFSHRETPERVWRPRRGIGQGGRDSAAAANVWGGEEEKEEERQTQFWKHFFYESQQERDELQDAGWLRTEEREKEEEEEGQDPEAEDEEDAEEEEEREDGDGGSIFKSFLRFAFLTLLLLSGGWSFARRYVANRRRAGRAAVAAARASATADAAAEETLKKQRREETFFSSAGSCSSSSRPTHELLQRGRALVEAAREADAQVLLQQRERLRMLFQPQQQQHTGGGSPSNLLYAADTLEPSASAAAEKSKSSLSEQQLLDSWEEQPGQPLLHMQPNGEWVWLPTEQ